MTKDLHVEPFDDATITKLEIFESYLKEWLPVFIEQACPKIYIVDFFPVRVKIRMESPEALCA